MSLYYKEPRPWWLIVIIILLIVPVFLMPGVVASFQAGGDAPAIQAANPSMIKSLTWLYPIITIVYGVLIWACWPYRSFMSWMLVVMSLLTTLAMFLLFM